MAEYITKEQAQDAVEKAIAKYIPTLIGFYEKIPLELCIAIRDIESNDVAPVIHAKWERVGSSSLIDPYRCSNCRKEPCKKQIEEYKTWGWDFTDYCPNCGAEMRGNKNDSN